MVRLNGTGIAGGEAYGKLYFFRQAEALTVKKSSLGADRESERFSGAAEKAAAELFALSEKCRAEMGDDAAALFETHAMLAGDADFAQAALRWTNIGCTAEYAVSEAGKEFSAMLEETGDEYLRERGADIRDVAARIASILTGGGAVNELSEPVIVAADDLAPSQTVQLDRSKILGFILREGSKHGHTAILARTMGIPAICSAGELLDEAYAGMTVCMDGSSGEIVIEPDDETKSLWEEKLRSRAERENLMRAMRGKDDITPGGVRMEICCNISSADDCAAVIENDGRGIGLFRSEFLYLASEDFPDEERQFSEYKRVIEAMNGRRVVIRTLDIGADKQAAYFGMKKEENPAMGMRAVRFCLTHPEIFRVQLRALYRASAYGKAAILFPMITSVWEVNECLRICRSVADELKNEGIPYDPFIEIGVMIETPASVLIADDLAETVDFFSIGTNDLTQYTLACDRQRGGMERFCDPGHPAVLHSVKLAAEAAHRHGIWVGICGDLAADTDMLGLFVELGIDELSVPPSDVLPMRAALRSFGG